MSLWTSLKSRVRGEKGDVVLVRLASGELLPMRPRRLPAADRARLVEYVGRFRTEITEHGSATFMRWLLITCVDVPSEFVERQKQGELFLLIGDVDKDGAAGRAVILGVCHLNRVRPVVSRLTSGRP